MSAALDLVGWTFLPSLATSLFQSFLYRLLTPAGSPQPSPNSPRYVRDRRRIQIAVVALYLLYTIYDANLLLRKSPNFYTILGVSPPTPSHPDISLPELKKQFRKLSIQLHPDKAGANSAEHFVALKVAFDTLTDDAKRFAYERFGPEMLDWKHCTTMRDYLVTGVSRLLPYYIGTVVVLTVFSVLGKLEFGRYWRFYFLSVLILLEAFLISRPFPTRIHYLFYFHNPPLVQFEIAALLRKIALTSAIAVSQIGGLLVKPTLSNAHNLAAALERLNGISIMALNESQRMLATDLAPFRNTYSDGEFPPQEGEEVQETMAMRDVKRAMKEWIVEARLRTEPELRDAYGKAIQGRRRDAPAGARGTR